jgi:hypothetical protein
VGCGEEKELTFIKWLLYFRHRPTGFINFNIKLRLAITDDGGIKRRGK